MWSCDVTTGEVRKVRDAALPIDADSIVVSRASAPSADGIEIPMFVVHGRDVEPGGEDGYLDMEEVLGLRLNADLVVLSACRSYDGPIHNGEGVRGLARAFLCAGSKGVVCSLWAVEDIPYDRRQDPIWYRTAGADPGRDGCRVPLPWTADGPSFGFGAGTAHLPQPAWFGPLSVQAQQDDPASTLTMYREALGWRCALRTAESLDWVPGGDGAERHAGTKSDGHSVCCEGHATGSGTADAPFAVSASWEPRCSLRNS